VCVMWGVHWQQGNGYDRDGLESTDGWWRRQCQTQHVRERKKREDDCPLNNHPGDTGKEKRSGPR